MIRIVSWQKLVMLCMCALQLHMLSYAVGAENEDSGYVIYTDYVDAQLPMRSPIKEDLNNKEYYYSQTPDTITIISRLGKFIASYEDNYFMTESVAHSLKLAMDLWEDKLDVSTPINFNVCMSEDMPSNVAMSTTVLYKRISRLEAVPRSLSIQNTEYSRGSEEAKDMIRLNACVDWGCSWLYDDMYSGEYALTTYFLRHIAHILGFGSSVVDRGEGRWGFAVPRTLSSFDRLLRKNGQSLNFSDSPSAISLFFKDSVLVTGTNFSYPLYCSDMSITDFCGKYFSLGYDNVMEYPIKNAAQPLAIPNALLDVLSEIGWKVNHHDTKIVCDSVDLQGYGSIYP